MVDTIVVNLIGGPGCGKSTAAAGVFSGLKWSGVNCELALEFVKDAVWEKNLKVLDNQLYILANQHHRIWRLANQVDVIITDSPLFLSLIYGEKESKLFKDFTLELYNNFNNMTFFLERTKLYNATGRIQTEEEAKQIDLDILKKLKENNIDYETVKADAQCEYIITQKVLEVLNG